MELVDTWSREEGGTHFTKPKLSGLSLFMSMLRVALALLVLIPDSRWLIGCFVVVYLEINKQTKNGNIITRMGFLPVGRGAIGLRVLCGRPV